MTDPYVSPSLARLACLGTAGAAHGKSQGATLSAADHALMETLVVYLRTHGEARTREVLQLALLELDTPAKREPSADTSGRRTYDVGWDGL